ncbi:unnamed protein product [Mycena citricolor]|uniref:Methyltransferase domain-containing protein n=1 Tax=Mycena citricolor TaxID=2018698 RepID=A0AAD2K7F8_9AGAR|nr:unnamed protein product [Mycena citricolor]
MSANLPASNERYGDMTYWRGRAVFQVGPLLETWSFFPIGPCRESEDDASFDWFKTYSDLAPYVRELIPDKDARILMLGCGNSTLSQDMYDDGYKNIVNTDYSRIVIEQMRTRHETARPDMEWVEMDVRDLKFPDESFDVAIDKGTMDAMMTAKGDVWDPPEQVVKDCTAEVSEVLRTLKAGGTFIYLTFGQPHFRRRFLTHSNTTLQIKELGEAFHYYLYVVKKTSSG